MTEALKLYEMFLDGRCGKRFMNKGYWFVRPTREYTGNLNNGFVALHTLICCAANGITEIPPDHEVHHQCETKTHNHPSNLQLVTHKQHAIIHAQLRKEKRNGSSTSGNASTHSCPDCQHAVNVQTDSTD